MPDILTVEQVEKALDCPATEWEGNCYGVATMIVQKGLIEGRAVYGHFLGEVSKNSPFWNKRAGHPFVQHGWVEFEDGRILDPTRWSLEGVEPYIWVGDAGEEYDEGGNEWRHATRSPWPLFDDSQHDATYRLELLPEIVDELDGLGARLRDPLDPDQMDRDSLDPSHMILEVTVEQVFWLANIPVNRMRNRWHACELFIQIEEHGLKGYIPLDNYNLIMNVGGK